MKALPYILIALLAFGLGYFSRGKGKERVLYDTITQPPVVITRVETDTLLMIRPLPYVAWLTGDTIEIDGCRHAKGSRMYTDDTTYTAWVSGVVPSLDSIRVYSRTKYVDRTVYSTIKPKPKRWGIGFSAGYGFSDKGVVPYIGLSLNYNLINW